MDADGNYLPHLLPVDPTLHWANPPGGNDGRDTRPDFDTTPGAYTGPVPIVTHVHGAVGVGDESDGYAEAWFLPDAGNIPDGYATEGTWYDFFGGQGCGQVRRGLGSRVRHLPVPEPQPGVDDLVPRPRAGHDAPQRLCRPGGFYIVRGGPAGDRAVLDKRFRKPTAAVLPGPAPIEGDKFPPNKTYYEIPIAIQDRSFNHDGSLFYPDTRAFFDEFAGPYIPESDVSPIWNPEFFGNMIMVNGNTWPFQTVEQRRYRFRFLNGCQSRFLILDFSRIPGVEVWQIGNEGGFLAAPVNLTADHDNRLLMGLAERADVIVDFTQRTGRQPRPRQRRPRRAVRRRSPRRRLRRRRTRRRPARSSSSASFHRSRPTRPRRRSSWRSRRSPPCRRRRSTRKLALIEMMSEVHDGPSEAMLGTVDADGMPMEQMWSDAVSENPSVGDTEIWEFYNFTADAHPMHVHEVTFEVVNRQALVTNDDGETEPPAQLVGDPAASGAVGERASRTPSSPTRARSPASRRHSTRPASSSGIATSSSTRTTR